MNILIVYTHPNHESLNYHMLSNTLEGLAINANDHAVEVLDLYADHFNPVLIFNDRIRRRDMATNPDFQKYRDQLAWAEKIVFIYPIWWGRPPAMLLGYFDQVLATGFAYEYKSNGLPYGLLKNKSAVCISTMKGPTGYPIFFLNNAHKALMKKAVLNFIGIKDLKFFEFGSMESKKKKQAKALEKIHNYFQTI
jgi:NAD(P)H dehydrogenase (quinone)